jgi:hypothetical protein
VRRTDEYARMVQSGSMRLVIYVAAFGLSACTSSSAPPTPPSLATTAPTKTSSSSSSAIDDRAAIDGPVIRQTSGAFSEIELDAPVAGTLELDGTCLYIVSAFGESRYPLVWPVGTRWDEATTSVITPLGPPLPIGAEVLGAGGFYSIAEITGLVGSVAGSLASACSQERPGEVAIVNNQPDAISLAPP